MKRLSAAHGFIDPIALLARFSRFSQPSEMVAPTELLRAGAAMHARGLLNSQAIQHNLDWVWPYWVEQQFNPKSRSFIPRAFALTHINLTHRNWTAIGLPGLRQLPLVDPRGLVTPEYDGWSLDCWILDPHHGDLLPSRCSRVSQHISGEFPLTVSTCSTTHGHRLDVSATVRQDRDYTRCILTATAQSKFPGFGLVIAVRPYNPEGISFCETISLCDDQQGFRINKSALCRFDRKPEVSLFSSYKRGDVYHLLTRNTAPDRQKTTCEVGLATAAALFQSNADSEQEVEVTIPLGDNSRRYNVPQPKKKALSVPTGPREKSRAATLDVPDKIYSFLFANAINTLRLHSPAEILAGPYTYKRFWFRDAVLVAHAMLLCGLNETALKAAELFFSRQKHNGYFESQEGEWDSNGQVLWVFNLMRKLTLRNAWNTHRADLVRAAEWIIRKRREDRDDDPHHGLLPAGFSAEHLGPNDDYYWDNFWGIAGLRAAADLAQRAGDQPHTHRYSEQAARMRNAVERSLHSVRQQGESPVMPPSPFRRQDSASVGSLVAGYPLQLFHSQDPRLLATADYLLRRHCIENALFHDVSHSGLNPYLTLHIAQVLLRGRDVRYSGCIDAIANLASPTGQWPEAIHPQLKTGCMGDGEHVWAAAEWLCIIRNLFVREEYGSRTVHIGEGLLPRWLKPGNRCALGPLPTTFGPVTVNASTYRDHVEIEWQAEWNGEGPTVVVDPLWGETISQSAHEAVVKIRADQKGESLA